MVGDRRDPAIRTMASDVAEFLKKTKPSLLELAAAAVLAEKPLTLRPPARPIPWRFSAGIGVALLVLSSLGWAAIHLASRLDTELPSAKPGLDAPPAGFVAFDQTRDLTIALERANLVSALGSLITHPGRTGGLERISIRVDEAQTPRIMTMAEFLTTLGLRPATGLADNAIEPPQFFLWLSLIHI